MSKNSNKDTRAPINQQESVNKLTDKDKIRMAMGKQLKLDASYYINHPNYAGMAWRWCPDDEVDTYLDIGMRLTPRRSDRTAVKHINSDVSEWVCVAVKNDMKNYLLHMPQEEYDMYFTQPKAARRAELEQAMTRGKVEADDQAAGGGLKTYAGKIGAEGAGYNPVR